MACSCGGSCGRHRDDVLLPVEPGFAPDPAFPSPEPWNGEALGAAGCVDLGVLPLNAEVLPGRPFDEGMPVPAGDDLESFRAELLAEVRQLLESRSSTCGGGGGGGGVPTSRSIATTTPLTGGGDLSADRTLGISDFVASGASHARGAVPDPGASSGTTKFLREDATWAVPPGGGVPSSRSIATTAPLTGGGDLSADRTLAVSDFVASGASHARGAVPDPGASSGTTKFLREDATWAVPPGSGSEAAANKVLRALTWI